MNYWDTRNISSLAAYLIPPMSIFRSDSTLGYGSCSNKGNSDLVPSSFFEISNSPDFFGLVGCIISSVRHSYPFKKGEANLKAWI